ncbi:unnamed protein product [Brassica rapa subsp. trilocularis]
MMTATARVIASSLFQLITSQNHLVNPLNHKLLKSRENVSLQCSSDLKAGLLNLLRQGSPPSCDDH